MNIHENARTTPHLRAFFVQQMQAGLTHGKTPMQTLRESLKIAKEKNLSQPDLSDSNLAA